MSTLPQTSPKPNSAPSLGEVLEWCAKAGPKGWFPSSAVSDKVSRESLYEPTLDLLRLGFIEAVAWERGRGQGFALTELGRSKLGTSFPLTQPTPLPLPVPADREMRLTTYDRGENARKAFAIFEPGRVSKALLVLICFWFVYGLYQASKTGTTAKYLISGDAETLLKIGAVTSSSVYEGDWWRLITCNFIHIGLLHLFLNGYSLYLAGSIAERFWGSRKFLVIFALSAIGGSSLAIAINPFPVSILAGASAGIWGILLSIGVWMYFNYQHLPPTWVRNFFRRSILILIINIGVSTIPGVSWQGHLGGAIAGILSSFLLHYVRIGSLRSTYTAIAILIVSIPFCVWSFRQYAESSQRWEKIRITYKLLHEKPDMIGLRQESLKVSRITERITLGRIIALHSNGAKAMTTGNKNQLEQVTLMARSLSNDCIHAVTLFNSIAESTDLHSPSDAKLIRTQSQFFQRIANFAESVAACTSATPPDMKRWLTLHSELKQIEAEFLELSKAPSQPAPSPKPQPSNNPKP